MFRILIFLVTGINMHVIAPITCFICIFYTTLGGLKAVVWTDTLQFSIMIGAMLALAVLGTKIAGGFINVWQIAEEGDRLQFFKYVTHSHQFYVLIVFF